MFTAGRGAPILKAAVQYYLLIEEDLKDKPNDELEGLVKKLNPKVRVDDTVVGLGLTTMFSTLIGAAICDGMGIPAEQAGVLFFYLGLPSLAITTLYGLTYEMGRGLEYRYKRDAALSILEKRKGKNLEISLQKEN